MSAGLDSTSLQVWPALRAGAGTNMTLSWGAGLAPTGKLLVSTLYHPNHMACVQEPVVSAGLDSTSLQVWPALRARSRPNIAGSGGAGLAPMGKLLVSILYRPIQ